MLKPVYKSDYYFLYHFWKFSSKTIYANAFFSGIPIFRGGSLDRLEYMFR